MMATKGYRLIRYCSCLKTLEHEKRLNLIVFDEVHKLLTDHRYRDVFLQFWVLNLVKTPIVALDGSIPPACLSEFSGLTNTTWRVLRTPSHRPELGYEVRRVSGDVVDAIVRDIPQFLSGYQRDDRLMVFCRTHQDVARLAKALNVPAFTSRTVEHNHATMDQWLRGETRVMVSTSILGCGLDYPSVRHVLHCGIAYSMLAQHQEESRAGRDGRPAMAITYVSNQHQASSYSGSGGNYGLSELHAWAATQQQCLQIIPSLYLDGVPITCSLLPGCTFCFYCAGQLHEDAPTQPLLLAS